MTMTTYSIDHTHGTTEIHDTWADTWASLVAVYGPSLYAVTPDGWEAGEIEPDLSCGRVLVWSTEDDSLDDDGARAVASVTAHD
jgi:hypothetical protein